MKDWPIELKENVNLNSESTKNENIVGRNTSHVLSNVRVNCHLVREMGITFNTTVTRPIIDNGKFDNTRKRTFTLCKGKLSTHFFLISPAYQLARIHSHTKSQHKYLAGWYADRNFTAHSLYGAPSEQSFFLNVSHMNYV